MNVGIVGLGNFGTSIGQIVATNGFDVLGWEYDGQVVEDVNNRRSNTKYLPGIELDTKLKATSDLREVFHDRQVVFVAIPSAFIRGALTQVQDDVDKETIIVNLAKGIDGKTGLTSFQTVASILPEQRKVMLSGPSIANEFVRGMPTTVVLAGSDKAVLLAVANLLDNGTFRTRFSDDVIGVELGGILKNIYAIGLGLFDGKSIKSVNFRSVYLTIALEEITKFGIGMGAKMETFLYLSGIGDLLATSLSEHSHNRRLGELLAREMSLEEIKREMGVLPEGFNTLKVTLYIAEKLHVSMPLARGLWDVIHGRVQAEKFITSFIKDFVE